jgi:hypothetical protein
MDIKIQEFIKYVDEISFGDTKDINGVKNIVETFSELFKKNDIADDDIMFLAKNVFERIKEEAEDISDEYLALMVGTFVGYVLGKYSKKLEIKNFKL